MELENLKNVGPKILNELNKLGIFTVDDLKEYYPFRYEIIKKTELIDGDKVTVDGIISKTVLISYVKMKKDKMSFQIDNGNNLVNIIIFNRGYLKNKLVVGTEVTILGKYNKKTNTILASDIIFGLLGNMMKIEPIYHVTAGLNSSKLNRLICSLDYEAIDFIPKLLTLKYNFMSKKDSLKIIHNPKNTKDIENAQLRLKYEEIFIFMLKMNFLKQSKNKSSLKRCVDYNFVLEFIEKIPFTLTADQTKSILEIYEDLTGEKRMNRLLQGDVGSGKTIVAFIAIYINFLGGYQSALMSPTEILAIQHFNNFNKLFKNLKVCLLTGKSKNKKKLYDDIANGVYDVIIGTNALINETLQYKNLGLVITDEQHRFGVNQRNNLKNKGHLPDILYMSATPIPRTYAITLFGDMDVSVIKTKPTGRKEIITYLRNSSEIKSVLLLMLEQLKLNHQIYVVAPLIDESDKMELENVMKLYDKMNLAFGKLYKIGVMHGRLSSKEKENVMDKFYKNEIHILISTTVVEVGVDVKNATCMVVFDSYRFGLSALHQLRGRIGRSDLQSYFVLISDIETKRLEVLVKTNDGFKVSEFDFKLRGSGEMFGVKQSGDMQFKLADLKKDYTILLKAKEDSEEIIAQINEYPLLCKVVEGLGNLS